MAGPDAGPVPDAFRCVTIPAMEPMDALDPATRIYRMLRLEPVIWLSTVRPDGSPHLVPIWFSWDGEAIIVASKPGAQKVRNIRASRRVTLALGEPEEDFDVGIVEGEAELIDAPASRVLPPGHCAKYRAQMAAIGLDETEFLETYSQVIRIVPTRFLPWHGRTSPPSARATPARDSVDRRLARAIRRAAATLTVREPESATA